MSAVLQRLLQPLRRLGLRVYARIPWRGALRAWILLRLDQFRRLDRAGQQWFLWRLSRRCVRFFWWALDPRPLASLIFRRYCAWLALYVLYHVVSRAVGGVWERMHHMYRGWRRGMGAEYYMKRASLQASLHNARSYAEWSEVAKQLDALEGMEKWRRKPQGLFNRARIADSVRMLSEMVDSGDVDAMMRYVRSRLLRNLGGVGSRELYDPVRVGTKSLIMRYRKLVGTVIQTILKHPSVPLERKLAFFKETRHSYGRTALLLSGGATMGLYHLGVIKALHECGMLPQVLSGSSVGSIICALVGTKTDAELRQLGTPNSIRWDFFPDRQGSYVRRLRRLLSEGVLMDVSILAETCRGNIGDVTFEEAYQLTGRIINITVTPMHERGNPLLLNFLTSPNVLIWSAAVASCALPGVFSPVQLMAKTACGQVVPYYSEGVKWMDGSVAMDLPIERLRELFNVNHFIVSQVNPHVVPFIFQHTQREMPTGLLLRLVVYLGKQLRHMLTNLWSVSGLSTHSHSVSKLVNFFRGLFEQVYEGDITLVPHITFEDFCNLLTNPSDARMLKCVRSAQHYTWTRLNLVFGRCEIEFMLDRAVRTLRGLMLYRVSRQRSAHTTHQRTARPQNWIKNEPHHPITMPRGERKVVSGANSQDSRMDRLSTTSGSGTSVAGSQSLSGRRGVWPVEVLLSRQGHRLMDLQASVQRQRHGREHIRATTLQPVTPALARAQHASLPQTYADLPHNSIGTSPPLVVQNHTHVCTQGHSVNSSGPVTEEEEPGGAAASHTHAPTPHERTHARTHTHTHTPTPHERTHARTRTHTPTPHHGASVHVGEGDEETALPLQRSHTADTPRSQRAGNTRRAPHFSQQGMELRDGNGRVLVGGPMVPADTQHNFHSVEDHQVREAARRARPSLAKNASFCGYSLGPTQALWDSKVVFGAQFDEHGGRNMYNARHHHHHHHNHSPNQLSNNNNHNSNSSSSSFKQGLGGSGGNHTFVRSRSFSPLNNMKLRHALSNESAAVHSDTSQLSIPHRAHTHSYPHTQTHTHTHTSARAEPTSPYYGGSMAGFLSPHSPAASSRYSSVQTHTHTPPRSQQLPPLRQLQARMQMNMTAPGYMPNPRFAVAGASFSYAGGENGDVNSGGGVDWSSPKQQYHQQQHSRRSNVQHGDERGLSQGDSALNNADMSSNNSLATAHNNGDAVVGTHNNNETMLDGNVNMLKTHTIDTQTHTTDTQTHTASHSPMTTVSLVGETSGVGGNDDHNSVPRSGEGRLGATTSTVHSVYNHISTSRAAISYGLATEGVQEANGSDLNGAGFPREGSASVDK